VPPADHRVILLGRADCHLCEVAREAVARICAELGTPWAETDVDADPELQAEYGDRVPVVLIDGAEHSYFDVDEPRLRRVLSLA
jgi:glutaredoxin